MTKKTSVITNTIPAKTAPETPDNSPSEKTKHTFRQRLARLLMTTETKNKDKNLVSELKNIKDAMHENFCKEGTWKSEYINRIFRLYADKNEDIKIFKPQFKLFSKYSVDVPGISKISQQKKQKNAVDAPEAPQEEVIRITQYIKTLKFIRTGLAPLMNDVKLLIKESNAHATAMAKQQPTEDVFSAFDNETNAVSHHVIAKKHLQTLMNERNYDRDRFMAEHAIISDCFEKNNYKDLMIFALLGFHYFERKNEVYESFSDDQKKNTQITFNLSGFNPTTLSLGAFLKIIEQLDFKKHIFSV